MAFRSMDHQYCTHASLGHVEESGTHPLRLKEEKATYSNHIHITVLHAGKYGDTLLTYSSCYVPCSEGERKCSSQLGRITGTAHFSEAHGKECDLPPEV